MDTGLSSGGRAEKCYGGGGCGGVIRTYVTVGQAGGRIELLLFRDWSFQCYRGVTSEANEWWSWERDKDALKEDCICYSWGS